MKDLVLSELRRFRWLAVFTFTVHLFALMLLNRASELFQQSYMDVGGIPILFVYLMVGLVFSIIQVGSYRDPSRWAWLIHRPLRPARIFAALALSSLLLLGFAIFLPQLLLLVGTDWLSARVVDVRHYLTSVHALAFVMMAWMAGAYACISRSRFAIIVILAPLLLALHMGSTLALLAPVLLALAWLTLVSMTGFRANRDAPIGSHGALLISAFPLQLGLFLLCVILWRFLSVTGGILLGVDPLNTDFPPEGGLIATARAKPSVEISLGLEHSTDPRAASWRGQLPLLEPVRIGPYLDRFPVRQQLSNLQLDTGWYDEERRIEWTFSHDRMTFAGRDPASGQPRGVFGKDGVGGSAPFETVPVVTEQGDILTRARLYALDVEAQSLTSRFTLRENEAFTLLPKRAFNRLILLTNQRLVVLREDTHAAMEIKPLIQDWELELPRGPQHLRLVTLAKLMDGWLVSIVYGDGVRQIGFTQFNTINQPWQRVLFIDGDGMVEVVGERIVDADYPVLQRTDWWLSPPLDVIATVPETLIDKGLTWPVPLRPFPETRALYWAALAMLLISIGAAWWWLRGTRVTRARRGVWLASCAVLGLPALLSLFILEPRE